MGIEELEELMAALGELKKKVTVKADELSMINGSSSLPSSSNSTMKIARFGAEEKEFNQAIDYCSSIPISWFVGRGHPTSNTRGQRSGSSLNDKRGLERGLGSDTER
ncbi:hypothetical protein RND71_006987 [Anisodus tanguticus]|uniref:Uncharacterized protein n=1 Tax=Anisodus tanguticus TaxID=243964 RepID=A0AAE1SV20_9SOLA|nr:hypothetical protein RND71_006987 [Anisodus tanguticus]